MLQSLLGAKYATLCCTGTSTLLTSAAMLVLYATCTHYRGTVHIRSVDQRAATVHTVCCRAAKLPKQSKNDNDSSSTQQSAAVAAEHEQAAHTALHTAIATLIRDSDVLAIDCACTWSQQQLIETCTKLCDYATQGLTSVGAAGRKGSVLLWSVDDAVDDWESLA
jgi:hypothetical protein